MPPHLPLLPTLSLNAWQAVGDGHGWVELALLQSKRATVVARGEQEGIARRSPGRRSSQARARQKTAKGDVFGAGRWPAPRVLPIAGLNQLQQARPVALHRGHAGADGEALQAKQFRDTEPANAAAPVHCAALLLSQPDGNDALATPRPNSLHKGPARPCCPPSPSVPPG